MNKEDQELKDWNEAFGTGELKRENINKFLGKYPLIFKCSECGKITKIVKVEDWKNCSCGSTSFEIVMDRK